MDVKSYLEKIKAIAEKELMSLVGVCKELDISYATWKRINATPETCALKTKRKLKKFVDERDGHGTGIHYE